MTTAWTRIRTMDVIGPLLGLGAVALLVAREFWTYPMIRDEAIYAYAAQEVAAGQPPYVGILNRAGPLAHAIPALGVLAARLVDAPDLLGIRTLMVVLSGVTIWVTYLLGRTVFDSRLAGVVTVLGLLTVRKLLIAVSSGPPDKPLMMLFLVCAFLAVVRRRWMTAGAFTALATLAWQPVFLTLAAGALVAMVLGREFVRSATRFVIGGLVPTLVSVLGFWIAGALRDAMDAFLLINMRYTEQQGLMRYLSGSRPKFWEVYGLGTLSAGIGVVALLALAVRCLGPALRLQDQRSIALVAAAGSVVAGSLFSLNAFNGTPDAFVLLPFAMLGLAGTVLVLREHLPPVGARLVVGTVCLALVVLAGVGAAQSRGSGLEGQRAATTTLLGQLPRDATVLSVGAPHPLVLTGRRNATRHQMFLNGLQHYVDDTWPGGLAGYARWIEDTRPTVIAIDQKRFYDWLRPTLRRHYVQLDPDPGWEWFVRRSAVGDGLTGGGATIDR